ncbi:MAG TPA: hypothetical protein DDY31_10815, partial [Lachnospiraceae bacterium]|nr:hypothetical protein [Lachnospiraceae bacterium]
MGRFTERDEFGNADIIGVDSMGLQCNLKFDEFNRVTNALNKLAEYEDLEEKLQSVYGKCDDMLQKVVECLERHEGIDIPEPIYKARLLTDGEVDRWEEFKALEEQGKML